MLLLQGPLVLFFRIFRNTCNFGDNGVLALFLLFSISFILFGIFIESLLG